MTVIRPGPSGGAGGGLASTRRVRDELQRAGRNDRVVDRVEADGHQVGGDLDLEAVAEESSIGSARAVTATCRRASAPQCSDPRRTGVE
jgi:hypothetical protein